MDLTNGHAEKIAAMLKSRETMVSVPYSAIDRFEAGFVDAYIERVREIVETTQFIGGDLIKKFELRLAAAAGVREARVCANGTDAIQLALRALGVGSGDFVLIPDSTFWATFEAVCNVGARPITLDIDPTDLHPSVEMVEQALDQFKPKVMILVHLYGWAARDTVAIRELCKSRGVALLEDSAQAWGVEIDGEPLMKGALVSTTSFYPGKVLGGAGDGGAVFTQDPALATSVHRYANHGRLSKYEHGWVGWNSRLDVIQVAFLDLALNFIEKRLASRRSAVDWYRRNVRIKGIDFLSPAKGILENGYISVARVSNDRRKSLMAHLDRKGIGYSVVYPGPMHAQSGAVDWLAGKVDIGNTAYNCASVINLPCFAGISEAELKAVKEALEEFFQ